MIWVDCSLSYPVWVRKCLGSQSRVTVYVGVLIIIERVVLLIGSMLSDVVYFDFSKAFDSVNHDLIIDKLKNSYSIDGRLLKLLKNYICELEQSVVLGSDKPSSKPVLSGVPQGSIL